MFLDTYSRDSWIWNRHTGNLLYWQVEKAHQYSSVNILFFVFFYLGAKISYLDCCFKDMTGYPWRASSQQDFCISILNCNLQKKKYTKRISQFSFNIILIWMDYKCYQTFWKHCIRRYSRKSSLPVTSEITFSTSSNLSFPWVESDE